MGDHFDEIADAYRRVAEFEQRLKDLFGEDEVTSALVELTEAFERRDPETVEAVREGVRAILADAYTDPLELHWAIDAVVEKRL